MFSQSLTTSQYVNATPINVFDNPGGIYGFSSNSSNYYTSSGARFQASYTRFYQELGSYGGSFVMSGGCALNTTSQFTVWLCERSAEGPFQATAWVPTTPIFNIAQQINYTVASPWYDVNPLAAYHLPPKYVAQYYEGYPNPLTYNYRVLTPYYNSNRPLGLGLGARFGFRGGALHSNRNNSQPVISQRGEAVQKREALFKAPLM